MRTTDMPTNLFLLRQASLWGDYGDVLVSGYASRDEETGRLLLHRGGPFTPPVFFPWCDVGGHALVVTDAFRKELQRSPAASLDFRPAVKHRIVNLSFAWQRWDRNAETPPRRPKGGDPEAYLWDEPHAPAIAADMPELWEVLPPVLPCKIEMESRSADEPDEYFWTPMGADYRGLFRDREEWCTFVVDRPMRDWLQQHAAEWVRFEPLVTK
jgi:hypothetical protein